MTVSHFSGSLIQLAPQYAEVIDAMLEAGGDLSDEQLAEKLNAIEGAFTDKVERCQMAYRMLNADAVAAEEFAQPYVDRALMRRKAAERLKLYVYHCLKLSNQTKVETPLGGARLQKSPPAAAFTGDPRTLPTEYQRIPPVEFNAKAAIDTHKAGQPLPDGVKITQGDHLRWI